MSARETATSTSATTSVSSWSTGTTVPVLILASADVVVSSPLTLARRLARRVSSDGLAGHELKLESRTFES